MPETLNIEPPPVIGGDASVTEQDLCPALNFPCICRKGTPLRVVR